MGTNLGLIEPNSKGGFCCGFSYQEKGSRRLFRLFRLRMLIIPRLQPRQVCLSYPFCVGTWKTNRNKANQIEETKSKLRDTEKVNSDKGKTRILCIKLSGSWSFPITTHLSRSSCIIYFRKQFLPLAKEKRGRNFSIFTSPTCWTHGRSQI